jgi:hypothetical protein
MSNQGLTLVKIKDPRSNVKHSVEMDAVVYDGPRRIQEQVRPAISWTQVGAPIQTQWTINPKTNEIVDRHMRMRFYFEIQSVGGDFTIGDWDCLRQMPLHAILENITVRINGIQISDTISDKIHALLCYGNNPEQRNKAWSTTAAQPDQTQDYGIAFGSARNVAAEYGENSLETSRGGFIYDLVNPTTIRVTVTEPILLSPFMSGIEREEEGFVNVNQIDVNLLFRQDVSRIMSTATVAAGNPEGITGYTVSQPQAPELLYNLITPSDFTNLPEMQILPYSRLNTYPKLYPGLAFPSTTQMRSDAFKLSIVPTSVFIFAKRSRTSQTFNTTDTFLGINRINVTYNNEVLFSTSSQQELYDIASRNGCNLSYAQWGKYRGAVLKLVFGRDIGLPQDESPGVQSQGTIEFLADMVNLSGAAIDAEFFVVFQYSGTLSIAENSANINLGTLTKLDAIEGRGEDTPVLEEAIGPSDLGGDGFWSSLKGVINKVARGVQTVAPFAQKAATFLGHPEIAAGIGTAGKVAGVARRFTGGRLVGGRVRRR